MNEIGATDQCNCRLCEISEQFRRVTNKIQDKVDRDFLAEILTNMYNAELDRDWTECKLEEVHSFIKSTGKEEEFKKWLKEKHTLSEINQI